MLSIFTKYLVQYGRVCIPHIGSFELVCESPHHDVADKIFTAPIYRMRFSSKDQVTEHQYKYFSFQNTQADGRDALHSFGADLKSRIEHAPFQWNDFGTLKLQSKEILFDPFPLTLSSLQPVPALKVTRENAQHQVLVGDQEMRSGEVSGMLNQAAPQKQYYILAGWIILGLAIISIIIYLYLHNFQVSASGLQWKVS